MSNATGQLQRSLPKDLALALATTLLAIAAAVAAERLVGLRSPSLIFVVAVLFVALRTGMFAAATSAVLCFLAYDFLFVSPRLSFVIANPDEVVSVVAFLVIALVVSRLAARSRRQLLDLRSLGEHARALSELRARLAGAANTRAVFDIAAETLHRAFGADVVVLTRAANRGELMVVASVPAVQLLSVDLRAADGAATGGHPAGRFVDERATTDWWFQPLPPVDTGHVVGLRFARDMSGIAGDVVALASAMLRDVGHALERTVLVAELEAARLGEETERVRASLLASVSHDLRSPLSAMIGSASSIAAYGDAMSADERRDLLEAISTEGRRLDSHIQNLLDMVRLGDGEPKLAREWVGVDDIIDTAVARVRQVHPRLDVAADVPDDLPLLWVHGSLVQQALYNLLENAAKFSPSDAEVRVSARVRDGAMEVDVLDDGPGIAEHERDRVFDMFYSAARGDRGAYGTGLGLAICRGMVAAHGGTVQALAREGGGTTMRVRLPLAAPPANDRDET